MASQVNVLQISYGIPTRAAGELPGDWACLTITRDECSEFGRRKAVEE
jgi:hypothetical protein